MSTIALNTGTLDDKLFQRGCNCIGFTPNLSFTYNSSTNVVVVTDASVLPAGDSLRRINVLVHDEFGNSVPGTITAALGNTGNISTASLNRAKGLHITATVVTTKDCKSDGTARNIGASGSLTNWNETWQPELAG